jgi:streptogramin lyase
MQDEFLAQQSRVANLFFCWSTNGGSIMIQCISSSRDRRTRYRHAIRHLETLEPRTLLSAAISSYPLPNVIVGFGAYDSSGALWIYDGASGAVERLANGAVDSAPGSVIPLDFMPTALTGGPNGHIYAANFDGGNGYGAIDDIDTGSGAVNPLVLFNDSAESPIALTVTGDGAVWFVGQGTFTFGSPTSSQENLIGRVDPANGSLATFTTGGAISDSQANIISASGADSVWISMTGLNVLGQAAGTNRVAAASWNGTAISLTAYDVNTGTDASVNGSVYGLVSDPDGSVWFTLSNSSADAQHPLHSPDQIVHGVVDTSGGTPVLVQTAFIAPGASAATPQNYGALALDVEGHIWFTAFQANQFGVLDPSTAGGAFTLYDNPTDLPLYQTVVNADGTQISLLNGPDVSNTNSAIVQIDVGAPVVTFSGTANNVNIQEDTALNGVLLATFTASTPLTGYTATITWGDNTSSVVTPTLVPGSTDTYAIIVSGKSFAAQGTYNGVITVLDGTASVGELTFTSTIGDIPLNVTSFTASPIILRIVMAVGTFTDDGDLALSTWKATINWGDNTSSTGLIVRDPSQPGRYFVLAIHQYRTRGTYTARLTVSTTEVGAAVVNNTLTTTVTAR